MCSGTYVASEEVAEKSYAASLLPPPRRGAGMGLLAATNGVGDMASSALVGTLWALSPDYRWGFAGAGLQLLGALKIGATGNASNPNSDAPRAHRGPLRASSEGAHLSGAFDWRECPRNIKACV